MVFFDKCLYYDILKIREHTYNFSLRPYILAIFFFN